MSLIGARVASRPYALGSASVNSLPTAFGEEYHLSVYIRCSTSPIWVGFLHAVKSYVRCTDEPNVGCTIVTRLSPRRISFRNNGNFKNSHVYIRISGKPIYP